MFEKFVAAGHNSVIIKHNMKNAFRNITLLLEIRWLLRFCWRACFYMRNCPLFGLSTSLFIFNLFAETFYWVFQSFLGLDLEHYLDNFVVLLPVVNVTPDKNRMRSNNYSRFTDILGILPNETKDFERMRIFVISIEVDINFFTARILHNKL